MQTKLSVFCDRLIEAGWLAAAAVIPLFFNVFSSRVFEPDKLTLLRSIAFVMAIAFVVKTVDSLPTDLSLSAWLRRFATATPLSLPVLIFLSLYILTTVTSVVPGVSFWGSYQRLQGTLVNISYITVFFLTAHHLRTKVQLSRLVWVVILDASVISLYGIVQHFRLDPLPWGGDVIMRVTSSMGNAIFLAAYLIMAVPLTLAMFIFNISTIRPQVQLNVDKKSSGLRRILMSVANFLVTAACVAPPVIVGAAFFGFVIKAIQLYSYTRGLSEFAFADSLILIVGGLVTGGGLLLLSLSPFGASLYPKKTTGASLLRLPLAFFLSSLLTSFVLFQAFAILFSKSRGPWLGIGIGLVVFAYLALLRSRLYKLAIVATIGLVLVGSFVLLLNIKGSPVAELRTKSQYLERLGSFNDVDVGTNKVRRLIWFGDDVAKGAVGLIMSDPVRAVIGWGPESMYVAYNRFYPPDLAHVEARNASPDRSHNDYLDYLVTMGVLGLLSYLAVVVVFFYFAARFLWRSEDRYFQLAIIGFMAAIVSHLGETLVGIAIAATRTHFWLYLGAASALLLMSRPAGAVLANGGSSVTTKPIAARVRGATTSGVGSGARSQRARNRRVSVPPQLVAGSSRRGVTGWARFVPLLAYLLVTIFLTFVFLLTSAGQMLLQERENVKLVVGGGFLWLFLGMVLTAVWVGRDERPSKVWRSSRWWLYAALLVVGAFVILFSFLNSIIADIHFKKAQAYDNVGRFDISTREYVEALSWAQNQDFYFLFLGRAFLEMAKKAPDQKPTREIATVDDLFQMVKGRPAALSRDDLFTASLVSLAVAKDLNPLNTDNSANLGRLHRFWGEMSTDPKKRQEKLEISLRYYADALALSPNAAHLYDEWGLVYSVQGKFKEATEKFEKALSLDKQYMPTYGYLGETYVSQNQFDKAEEILRQGITIDNSQFGLHSSLGYVLHQQGKIQESLAENIKAAELAPNDFSTRRNLAVIYQQLGRNDKAIVEAQTALNLAPAEQKPAIQSFIAEIQRRMSGG